MTEGRRLIAEFDKELEEDEEVTDAQKAKAKWARLEAIVGNEERIRNLARDIVSHFEQRQKVFDGKAMIVAMSRRIAVDLYNEIIKLRPEWHDDDLSKGYDQGGHDCVECRRPGNAEAPYNARCSASSYPTG